MKIKIIIPIIFSILLGLFLGEIFFGEYQSNNLTVFKNGEKIYFVQLAVHKGLDTLKVSFPEYESYLTLKEDDGYHLYAAITKDEELAKKVQVYFKEIGKDTYIKEVLETNEKFLNVLSEYDKIANIVTNNKDLIDIEKITVSSYKEMVIER